MLPPRIRRPLVDLAAAVLGAIDPAEVPQALRRVRGFAPAQRARAGAAAIALALERDHGFRRRVAGAWRETEPELAAELDTLGSDTLGPDTSGSDTSGPVQTSVPAAAALAAVPPDAVAVGLFLLRPQGWPALLSAVLRDDPGIGGPGAAPPAPTTGTTLGPTTDEAWRVRAEAAEARSAELAREVESLGQELAGVRKELRRLRSDADRERARARAAEQALAEAAERSAATEEEHRAAVLEAHRRARRVADDAVAAAERARRDVREERALGSARVRLLLETLAGAVTGLRRELALPPVEQLPADLVADAEAGASGAAGGPRPGGVRPVPRALPGDDPAPMEELLALPRAHLVVDGYNVTKSRYGELTLTEQRRRLLDGLAALVARTGAEVTCCFDGAEADRPGAMRVRGVRVLFSAPGTTADALIDRLVRAEPPGRPLAVVSTDAEVAAAAVAAGARAVPSAALLRLLGRG